VRLLVGEDYNNFELPETLAIHTASWDGPRTT
jgi:hypothetical protein